MDGTKASILSHKALAEIAKAEGHRAGGDGGEIRSNSGTTIAHR